MSLSRIVNKGAADRAYAQESGAGLQRGCTLRTTTASSGTGRENALRAEACTSIAGPRRGAAVTTAGLGIAVVIVCAFALAACNGEMHQSPEVSADRTASRSTQAAAVKVGAHVLADDAFSELEGMRVGLIVNHTAVVDTTHLADLIHQAPGVEVTALFGPEHGIRGSADAGEKVEDGRDVATGAPIYSLYGSTRKPTTEMLRDVDALVYDIQDVGARFYTYISTLGLSMQAAAEKGIPFYVLDRPNPLGGEYVAGFLMEDQHQSFVGQYPIPAVYGMTVGELAAMITGEGLMPGVAETDLHVITMQGWERGMLWPETGLPWIPPSPNIPDFETALAVAGTVLFEAVSASEGRGTETPFTLLGAPWADGSALADTLNGRHLPGVTFEEAAFTPRSIEGMSSDPKLKGESLQGIRIVITDPNAFRPVGTGIHILHAFFQEAERQGAEAFVSRPEWLAKLSGSERLLDMLRAGASPADIIESWKSEVAEFRERQAPYLLY